MAIEYGITDQGFVIKTLDVLKEEADEFLTLAIGSQINLLPESIFGTLRDKYAERSHELWELFQALYNSCYPQTAEGVSLDNVCDFAALERLEARASSIVTQALFGDVGTIIPAGTKISVEDDSSTVFETDNEVTLISGTDEIQNIAFSTSPTSGSFTLKYGTEETVSLAYNASNSDVQTALNNLASLSDVEVLGDISSDFVITFQNLDGKQPHTLLTEGTNTLSPSTTITITVTTPGVYQGITSMTCIETGPKNANIKTLNVIDNPLNGFTRTFNAVDATLGRNIETDAELRIRRNNRVIISRGGSTDAIMNKILDLNDDIYSSLPEITDAIVYENDTDYTDAKNMPPHSIMAVVRQEGDVDTRDQEIAQAIYESKAAGINTSYGYANLDGNDVTKTVIDSKGISHTINFARPKGINIYLILDNFETNSNYPATGDDQLKAILTAWGNALGVGVDIIVYPTLVAQIATIPGITDFDLKIGITPSPTLDDNIDISDGISTTPEYSVWSTTNITITT